MWLFRAINLLVWLLWVIHTAVSAAGVFFFPALFRNCFRFENMQLMLWFGWLCHRLESLLFGVVVLSLGAAAVWSSYAWSGCAVIGMAALSFGAAVRSGIIGELKTVWGRLHLPE